MNKFLLCAAAIAGVLYASSAFAAVGHVTDLIGSATVARHGAPVALKKDDGVEQGDVIETAEKSRVSIEFADKTDLTVAEKGKLTINEYIYDPKNPAHDKSDLGILHTAFSYVGGLMDKQKDPNVALHLDFGSIGIRGTKIFRIMHNGECWIYVERGLIDVSNRGGAVHLKSGQGTIMSSQQKAPAAAHIWTAKEIAFIKDQVADPRLHKQGWNQ